MADSEQYIHEQLVKKKTKRNKDVVELYLAENNLSEVCNLACFQNLQYLYLNSNKLRSINCLSDNLRVRELYLQDNALTTVSGALEHLTCLEVLSLQNNQLQKLDTVVHELRNMHSLHTLNLFHNPVVQEAEYRLYVIYHIPSLKLLDRKEVLQSERDRGAKAYDQKWDNIKESIAFGRRSEGPPALHYPGSQDPLKPTTPANFEVGNNFYRSNSPPPAGGHRDGDSPWSGYHHAGQDDERDAVTPCSPQHGHLTPCSCIKPELSPPFPSDDDAINVRHLRRSVMEYTTFDWAKVPRGSERRLAKENFNRPQTITTRFR